MSAVLIVANKTLVAEELTEFVKARVLTDQTTKFTLLVPASTVFQPEESVFDLPVGAVHREMETRNYEHAQHKLASGLDTLRLLGATVDGLVGDPNPTKAVSEVLERRQFDEVVVFTLPKGISRWLHLDLPHQVERKFRVPVTVITTA